MNAPTGRCKCNVTKTSSLVWFSGGTTVSLGLGKTVILNHGVK